MKAIYSHCSEWSRRLHHLKWSSEYGVDPILRIVGMLPGSQSESLITLHPMENKKTALIVIGGLIIGLFIGYLIATNVIANR